MRKLKMKGLVLADVKLIKEMDNTIEGSSMLIPATVNKGDVGENTSGASIGTVQTYAEIHKRAVKGYRNRDNERECRY